MATLTTAQKQSLAEVEPPLWLNLLWGLCLLLAAVHLFRGRALNDIWSHVASIAKVMALVGGILGAIVAITDRPRFSLSEIPILALMFAFVMVLVGVIAYAFGVGMKDGYIWAYEGFADLQQGARPSDTRATFVAAGIPLVIGTALFGLRRKLRFSYGLTEVAVGVLVALYKIFDPQQADGGPVTGIPLRDSDFLLAMLTASVYLVVQGLDSIQVALTDDTNDWLVQRLRAMR